MVKSRAKKKAVRTLMSESNLTYAQALALKPDRETNTRSVKIHLIYGLTSSGKSTFLKKIESDMDSENNIRFVDEKIEDICIPGTYYVTIHSLEDREAALTRLSYLMESINPELRYEVISTTLCYRTLDKNGSHVFASELIPDMKTDTLYSC